MVFALLIFAAFWIKIKVKNTIRGKFYKTFTAVIYDFRNKLVFVPGKPFQPSLTFTGKAKDLPYSVATERVGSWLYPQTLN